MASVKKNRNVIKEGIMYKLSGFFHKTWELRYFRLQGRKLFYYKSESDTDGQPRQILNLRGARTFRAAEGRISACTHFCGEIQIVEPAPKSYFICTETEEYLNEWIEAINKASEYKIQEICELKGHEELVVCHAFSPDGKIMVTGTESGSMKVWDLKSYKLSFSLDAHRDSITQCGFFQGGTKFYSASMDQKVKIWDGKTFQLQKTERFESSITSCIVIFENKQMIVGMSTGEIKIGATTALQFTGALRGHEAGITSISASRDGKKLLTTSEDGCFICWNMPRGTIATTNIHPREHLQGVIAPNGNSFVLWDRGNSASVFSWENTIDFKCEMENHFDKITRCFFTPNSTKLITSSRDRSVLIWDVALSGQLLSNLSQNDAVRYCEISRNQQLLLVVTTNEVSLWDIQSTKQLTNQNYSTQIVRACFIPDFSGYICMQDEGSMRVWSL